MRCSIGSEKGAGGVEGEPKLMAAWSEASLDQAALDFFLKQGRCLSNGACAGRCTRLPMPRGRAVRDDGGARNIVIGRRRVTTSCEDTARVG